MTLRGESHLINTLRPVSNEQLGFVFVSIHWTDLIYDKFSLNKQQFLSNKLQPVEEFVYDKPFRALFILIAGIVFIFFIIYSLVMRDVFSTTTDFQTYKGRNGRLD